jgi:hypothetical protein
VIAKNDNQQVFCNRVNVVVKNLVQQLGSIYSPRPPAQAIDINNVHLDVVFQALGDALAVLATLDELIAANPVLLDHWTLCVAPHPPTSPPTLVCKQ